MEILMMLGLFWTIDFYSALDDFKTFWSKTLILLLCVLSSQLFLYSLKEVVGCKCEVEEVNIKGENYETTRF